jgi:hypothetical protein
MSRVIAVSDGRKYLTDEPLMHPPKKQQSCDKREWVGLTDDEIGEALMPVKVAGAGYYLRSARAIEAALKEKNT